MKLATRMDIILDEVWMKSISLGRFWSIWNEFGRFGTPKHPKLIEFKKGHGSFLQGRLFQNKKKDAPAAELKEHLGVFV